MAAQRVDPFALARATSLQAALFNAFYTGKLLLDVPHDKNTVCDALGQDEDYQFSAVEQATDVLVSEGVLAMTYGAAVRPVLLGFRKAEAKTRYDARQQAMAEKQATDDPHRLLPSRVRDQLDLAIARSQGASRLQDVVPWLGAEDSAMFSEVIMRSLMECARKDGLFPADF